MMNRRILTGLLCVLAWAAVAVADNEKLAEKQSSVAERYQRLEELLLRLSDVEAAENPQRAALLRRAARQSRDKFVLERLRGASESLKNQEFQKAVDSQGAAQTELASLLKLLMSEDRSKRIRDEKERYAKLMKDLKRNLNNQRSARARTENGADLKRVKKEQGDVTERSKELSQRLSEDDESESSESTPTESANDESENEEGSPSGDAKENESKPSDAKPSDSKPGDAKPGDSKPGDSKSGEGKPSDSQPKQSEPSESGQSAPSPAAQPQTPEQEVQEQLEKAIENMKQAEKNLDEAKRQDATDQQRKAEENLRAAIDRLERILRQLREEEMQRELAKLEARLRKMAAMQTEVLEKTKTLAATPKIQRDRTTDLKSGDLAFSEKKITLEANRAMLLLREEGSSVAFPEVIASIQSDTQIVADRLSKSQIDAVTQGIQADILVALEEMIEALQKAQRDLEEQRQQQQQGRPGQSGQGEQPLVQTIAELKLLRTMQTRVKSTTDRYSGLLESGEASGGEILPLLQDLSRRQNRLYQITRDLVLKRNQ